MTTDEIGNTHCDECKNLVGQRHWACDRTMRDYCDECWPKTACANGKHGEECPTMICEDAP